MPPRISEIGYKRVCPSVRRSVCHAFIKNEVNEHFWANKCPRRFTRLTRCIIVSVSVHQSVSPSVRLSHREYQHEYQLMEVEKNLNSQVISSLFDHSIIMRTHRWLYGPCFTWRFIYFFRDDDKSVFGCIPKCPYGQRCDLMLMEWLKDDMIDLMNVSVTDGPMDWQTDGRMDRLLEMLGCF